MPYVNPLTPEQKEKQRIANKKWQENNPGRYKASMKKAQKKYQAKNREKINAYYREYYKDEIKREKQIARALSWNKLNPDKIKQYRNTDLRKEYMIKWRKANREKILIYQDRHRKK